LKSHITREEEEKMMKKIAPVILMLVLIGCAELRLSPEAQRVMSVQDTMGCQFIKELYIETYPESLTYSLQWHTHRAGGNAYRIISQVRFSTIPGLFSKNISLEERALTTHFEIYNCKP